MKKQILFGRLGEPHLRGLGLWIIAYIGLAVVNLSNATPGVTNPHAAVFLGMNNTRSGFDGKQQPRDLVLHASYQETGSMFLTSPTISHGLVFGTTTIFDPPDTYGSVFCLDAETLKLRWRAEEIRLPQSGKMIELKGCISTPAITADGKFVIFGQGLHNDNNSHLLCLDSLTGEVQWAVESTLHIESSPTIHGDLVVVGCGAIEQKTDHTVKGHPGYVMAVRISDGNVLWEYPIHDPESAPAILDDTVFIGSGINGNKLVALRTSSDEELEACNQERLIWSVPTTLPITSPVTLAKGLVIAGGGNGTFSSSAYTSQGMVIAIDQKTGLKKWSHSLRDSVFGAIAVQGDIGIITCKSGEVIALNIDSGEILWKRMPKPGHAIISGAAFTGKYIYTVTTSGFLMVLDTEKKGKLLQFIYLNDPSRDRIDYSISTPTLVNGTLYVGSETGGLGSYVGKRAVK